jgi:hypothetical protein
MTPDTRQEWVWTIIAGLVALLIILLIGPGCITRGQINASVWLNNTPIPKDLCDREPSLKDYGFFRRLDSGQIEFVSFCSPQAVQWLAMFKDDFNRLMDEAGLPKPKPSP